MAWCNLVPKSENNFVPKPLFRICSLCQPNEIQYIQYTLETEVVKINFINVSMDMFNGLPCTIKIVIIYYREYGVKLKGETYILQK